MSVDGAVVHTDHRAAGAIRFRSGSIWHGLILMGLISGIDSMHTVVTEIGENASIQRQLITPLTHADPYEEGVRRALGQTSDR